MNEEIDLLLENLTHGDENCAEESSIKLAAFGNVIIPDLKKELEASEVDQRWWAVRTIAQLDSPSKDLLIKALEDPSEEVQQCAALAICHHPDPGAIPSLLSLLKHADTLTINLAATALISIGKESIPDLLEVFPKLSGVSRIEVTRAIALIQDERSIPTLMSALGDDSLSINYWAEEGLDRLGQGMLYFKPD